MTDDTREVEEKIIEEFQDKDHITTSDGKLYVEIDAHWLYHQLQKARQDWLREILATVDRINISTKIEFIKPKDQPGYYRCQEDIKKAILTQISKTHENN